MDALSEVASICHFVESDKVTERKKQVDKLKPVLEKPDVINALNNSGSGNSKKSNQLTWNYIFRVSVNVFDLDVASLNKGRDVSVAHKLKKRQDALSLIKHVIHVASRSGHCYLKCGDVVKLLMDILSDDSKCEMFGPELTSVILKDVLSIRASWFSLNAPLCQELVNIFCRLLHHSRFDQTVSAKALCVLVSGMAQHFSIAVTVLCSTLHKFFTAKSTTEMSFAVLEPVVRVAIVLCQSHGTDNRIQICRLGETIFVPLLRVWKNKPADRLKDDLVQFYQLQMAVHHPQGAVDETNGAFAVDWNVWKSHLKKLYEALYSDIEELHSRSRTRFTSSSRDTMMQLLLKDNVLQLTAAVCCQVFVDSTSYVEVTQLSRSTQAGSASKRRRVDTGWAMLRDIVDDHTNTLLSLPWIQLLTTVVLRHPHCLSLEETTNTVVCLHRLLVNCKLPDVGVWLLRCLLALTQFYVDTVTECHRPSADTLHCDTCLSTQQWTSVYTDCLRFVTVHSTQSDALHLITSLIKHRLCRVDAGNVWSLFESTAVHPTAASVCFLATFLDENGAPEHGKNTTAVKKAVRSQLLNWLMCNRAELSSDEFIPATTHLDAKLMSKVLVALTVRDAHVSHRCMCKVRHCMPVFSDIERLCLLSTFDDAVKLPLCISGAASDRRKMACVGDSSVLYCRQEELIDRLTADIDYSLAYAKPETKSLESMAWQCQLLMGIFQSAMRRWKWRIDDITKSDIFAKFKLLMSTLADNIVRFIHKMGIVPLSTVMQLLVDMVTTDAEDGCASAQTVSADDSCQMLVSLCRTMMPDSFIRLLLDQIASEMSTSKASSAGTTSVFSDKLPKNDSKIHDPFDDDFDIGDGIVSQSNSSSQAATSAASSTFDDEFPVSASQSQCSLAFSPGGDTVMSVSMLSESHAVNLLSVDFLCRLCQQTDKLLHSECVLAELVKLIDCDKEETWSCSKAFDVHLLSHVIGGLATQCHCLTEEMLETLIYSVHEVSKRHRKDQDVAVAILDMTNQLIPHLRGASQSAECCSQTLSNSRTTLVNTFGVYWTKRGDLYNPATRCAIVRCMTNFILADASAVWTVWKPAGSQSVTKMLDELPRALSDKSLSVRLDASSAVTVLFGELKSGVMVPFSRREQNKTFAAIYTNLQYDSQEWQESESEDRKMCLMSSIMHALSATSRTSPVCRKAALFAMLQSQKKHGFPVVFVKKVIQQLSVFIGYENYSEYVESYLPYLLHTWLECNTGALLEFSWQLCGSESQTAFLSKYCSTIAACLVMNKKMDVVKEMAAKLQVDLKSLLMNCLPHILVHILPLSAAAAADQQAKLTAVGFECYNMLIAELGKQTLERSVVENLEELVIGVLLALFDTDETQSSYAQFIMNSDPEPNPLFFSSRVVCATFDYLTQKHSAHANSCVMLLARTQDGIQRVLLALTLNLSSKMKAPDVCRAMSVYCFFVSLLLKDFKTGLCGGTEFILRTVLHTLLSTLVSCSSSQQSNLVQMTLDLLFEVVTVAVKYNAVALCRYVPAIASSLTSLLVSKGSEDVSVKVERLINCIVVDHEEQLSSVLVLLEPIPDTAAFDAARQVCHRLHNMKGPPTIRQEIEWFLNSRHLCRLHIGNEVSRLKYLYRRLTTCSELDQLITECQEKQCRLLLDLLHELVELAQTGGDDVALEAGRCLGLIGIIDIGLVTPCGRPANVELDTALSAMHDSAKMQQYCYIFHALTDYLTDSELSVIRATSVALKKLLSTKSGAPFIASYHAKCQHGTLTELLYPFKCDSKKKVTEVQTCSYSREKFTSEVDVAAVWCPDTGDYDSWICQLLCCLINSGSVHNELFQLLSPVCRIKTKFSELMLPYVVHDIVRNGTDTHVEVVSRQIAAFFAKHCVATRTQSLPGNTQWKSMCCDKHAVQILLSVVQYLRQQPKLHSMTAWDNNLWLQVDYLQLANAALNVSSYFTCLLYVEIWAEITRDQLMRQDVHGGAACSSDITVCDLERVAASSNINISSLMSEAYRAIGDPDGIYGCSTDRHGSTIARIKLYEHENDWNKAVGSYDLEMSANPTAGLQVDLAKALQSLGCSHVLEAYLQGLTVDGFTSVDSVREIQYEAACQNCKWDLELVTRSDAGCGYNQLVYSSLVGLKQQDRSLFDDSILAARRLVLRELNVAQKESCRSVYPSLTRLQCLTEMETIASLLFIADSSGIESVLSSWREKSAVVDVEYDLIQSILIQRCTLARLCTDVLPPAAVKPQLYSVFEDWAAAARKAGRFQVAEAALTRLRHLSSLRWRVEEAELFWARGELETAKRMMKMLVDDMETMQGDDDTTLLPKCLMLYGDWLAETRSQSPNVILEKYLSKAAGLLEKNISESCETAVDAFHSLARYVDVQYRSIVDHMNSSAFEAKQEHIRMARNDTEQLKKIGQTASDEFVSRYYRTLEKQRQIDEHEQQSLLRDRERFLLSAVDNFIKCLRHHDKYDLKVFRLISLWFDNACSDEISGYMKTAVDTVSSHKFLPLIYQLAARMSQSITGFQTVLHQLLESVSVDHPHHSLGVILSLANANIDAEIVKVKTRKSESSRLSRSSHEDADAEEDRVLAAKSLIAKLRTSCCSEIIEETNRLCVAYVELANYNVDKFKGKNGERLKLPSELVITKLKDLKNVCVPTLCSKVSKTCCYDDIVYVAGFLPTFTLAGGINLPKIIACIGSDGVHRRQLVKGKDDLRQDAVMQQVFSMVNSLLAKNSETRRRNLTVRTYKVVPLSQRSGILEWCEGTVPMGEYLIGVNGAHQRYRPDDWKAIDCRKAMSRAHTEGLDDAKRAAFREVCAHFQPVFHHFFLEKFTVPAEWYERRVAYTRSVATNSMVGYILGLGDRHVQNILIDCRTAEMVHIDLGVAFEQGRILPTPETVPFRLTHDVVDGMGIAGVEGIFRRCCEKTMQVMHASHDAILTIVQVLLYDPLYVWTISPVRGYQLQHRHAADVTDANMNTTSVDLLDQSVTRPKQDSVESVNKVAERVLLRLRQKLSGLEDGVKLSIAGQVNHLIQEARDENNLCRLFPGWQAYI